MAEITLEASWRRIRALTGRAENAAGEKRRTAAVARWRSGLAHPCAHHRVVADEVLNGIHRVGRQADHHDDAIAARSSPAATPLQADRAVAWPPGRNVSCWCGSDRRDEKSCGPVPAAVHVS